MDKPIVRRRLVGTKPVSPRGIWRTVLVLAGAGCVLAALGATSNAQTGPAYPCGSWNAGMVNQQLHEINTTLDDFWDAHANNYGPPEVLTDSHYSDNRSAYIYPNNLTQYIPTFEPPNGASEATKDYARIGNACIDLQDPSSGVPAPYNSFMSTHPNLLNRWKTLADSVTTFEPRSLHMTEANRFHVNNNAYCTRTPRPADCTSPYRAGPIAGAYKLFYENAIYRSGAGDVRNESSAFPEDYFRIWTTPRNTNGTAMTFGQFGDPNTIPNNLENRQGNNGTVVFSNTFTISEADYHLYQTLNGTTTGALTVQGIADDYLGMWLNGRPIAFSVKSGNAFISRIDPASLNPPVNGKSTNVIKSILFDKYIINEDRSDYQQMRRRSMGSGFLYSMMYFPPKNAPLRVSCGTTTFPGTLAAGRPLNFTVGARINGPFNPPLRDDINPGIRYSVTGPGGYTRTGAVGYTPRTASGITTLTSDTIGLPATPLPLGTYDLTWSITSPNLMPDVQNCSSDELLIGDQPYFITTGGDMWAGTPDADSDAVIRSWNEDAAAYKGAGSQIAALATGDIQSFISGKGLSGGVGSGYGLSFANTPTPGGSGAYGGAFKSIPAVKAPTPEGCVSEDGLFCVADGSDPDSVTVSGTLAVNSKPHVIYAENDVYITGNITFGAYTSISQIPHLDIMAGRNIYIVPGVTEVHGNLWAQGSVYTCDDYNYSDKRPPNRGVCQNPLKIYGTVAAKDMYLLRTAGNWVNGGPAEEFIYSPEVWLNRGSGEVQKIDAYVSLPPIL